MDLLTLGPDLILVIQVQDVLLAHNGSLEGGNVFLSKEWRRIEEKCPEGWKEVKIKDVREDIEGDVCFADLELTKSSIRD